MISPRLELQKLQDVFIQNEGGFKKVKLGELFIVKNNPQLNKESFCFEDKAEYPYFTRTILNNGILGYVEYLDEEHKIDGNSIAVGMLQMQFFYMEKDFYAGQFTKTIFPKFEKFNSYIGRYFTIVLNKFSEKFLSVLVRDFKKIFLETEITLPYYKSNNQIAFDYMEKFIEIVNNEKIQKINNFLSNLHDQNDGRSNPLHTIKNTEINALNAFKNLKNSNKISWKSFELNDLFIKLKTNKLNLKSADCKDKKIDYIPATTCSTLNQSLTSFVPKESATILKNCISVNANGNAMCFYQPNEFTILQDSYAIEFISEKIVNEKHYLFLVSILNKVLKNYDWNNKSGWEKVKTETIQLPQTSDGNIDFELMQNLISAIEKIIVQNLIKKLNIIQK